MELIPSCREGSDGRRQLQLVTGSGDSTVKVSRGVQCVVSRGFAEQCRAAAVATARGQVQTDTSGATSHV